MRVSKIIGISTCTIAALAYAGVALASHGKAGLWQVSVTMNMGGVAMPDMSQLPPEAQARMKAMGVHMGGNTVTAQKCMTAAEVASDQPPSVAQSQGHDCQMVNAKTSGQSFHADMVCKGEMNAKGHLDVTYDSAEHYSGKTTMVGSSGGQPVNMSQTFEGHWLKSDCGAVR